MSRSSGNVLVTGGAIQDPLPTNAGYTTPTATAELYDPASGTSTPAGSMSVALEGHQAILQNGKVLILGPASAQIYDPWANAFSPVTGSSLMSSAGGFTATTLLDGRVLITGGSVPDPPFYGDLAVDTAEIYDPASGKITLAGSKMNVPRYSHTATLMPNGTVLIAGGATLPPPGDTDPLDSGANNTTEIFDPSTNVFTRGRAMQTPREGHTATLLPDGTVLIVGGSSASRAYPRRSSSDGKTGAPELAQAVVNLQLAAIFNLWSAGKEDCVSSRPANGGALLLKRQELP